VSGFSFSGGKPHIPCLGCVVPQVLIECRTEDARNESDEIAQDDDQLFRFKHGDQIISSNGGEKRPQSDTGSFGTKKRLRASDYQFGGYRSFCPAFGRSMPITKAVIAGKRRPSDAYADSHADLSVS